MLEMQKDMIIFAIITVFILVISYFFDIFKFLVELFQKNPQALTYIDEILTALITLSIGFAIFSWRRWLELKKETARSIKLQEELLKIANTHAETERIISKQLRSEIEERKKEKK